MKINLIKQTLESLGKTNEHHAFFPGDWRYYMPFSQGYHATALAKNYIERFSVIWSVVKPKRYLVIGILLGTSESLAMYQTKHYPNLIVATDIDLDSYNEDRNNMAYAYRNMTDKKSGNYPNELVLIRTDSKKTDLHKKLGPYDFIFVDGEHGYNAVQKDLDNARDCVAPGGVIMVHDLDLPGANDSREIKESYHHWLKNNNFPHVEISQEYFQLGLGLIQM